jgi:hypothetical protein
VESLTHEYPEKTVHLRFYCCRWKQHEPQPLGCPAFQWITAAELKDYDFPAADARLLGKLQSLPKLWQEHQQGSQCCRPPGDQRSGRF